MQEQTIDENCVRWQATEGSQWSELSTCGTHIPILEVSYGFLGLWSVRDHTDHVRIRQKPVREFLVLLASLIVEHYREAVTEEEKLLVYIVAITAGLEPAVPCLEFDRIPAHFRVGLLLWEAKGRNDTYHGRMIGRTLRPVSADDQALAVFFRFLPSSRLSPSTSWLQYILLDTTVPPVSFLERCFHLRAGYVRYGTHPRSGCLLLVSSAANRQSGSGTGRE